MGLSSKRHYALQSSVWTFYGLVTICLANHTIYNTSNALELSNANHTIYNTSKDSELTSENQTIENTSKGPKLSRSAKELSEHGKEALIVICFGLIIITIISIFAHYCNFEVKQRKLYKKLHKSTEMVDVNLYESEDEEAHTAS